MTFDIGVPSDWNLCLSRRFPKFTEYYKNHEITTKIKKKCEILSRGEILKLECLNLNYKFCRELVCFQFFQKCIQEMIRLVDIELHNLSLQQVTTSLIGH